MRLKPKCMSGASISRRKGLPSGGCCCTAADALRPHYCRIAASRVTWTGFGIVSPLGAAGDNCWRAGHETTRERGHLWNSMRRVQRIGRRLARVCTTRRTSTTRAGWGSLPISRGARTTPSSATALAILENLTHRGATGADPLQGDGAGILIQLPDAFLRRACGKLGHHAAGDRPVRRRHGVPAARAGVADGLRAGNRARDRGGRPGAARLARRAHRQQRVVRAHEGSRAGDPPGVHRPRRARRSTRTRSSASST